MGPMPASAVKYSSASPTRTRTVGARSAGADTRSPDRSGISGSGPSAGWSARRGRVWSGSWVRLLQDGHAQERDAAVDVGLDGVDRPVEYEGALVVGETVDVAQLDGGAVAVGQRSKE